MSLRARAALIRGSFSLEVELEASENTTTAVLGPNAAGKSTLLEALVGLIPLRSGEIELDGEILERPAEGIRVPPRERPFGVMYQGLWLFPHLSVRDNVAFGPWARGLGRREARREVDPMLERLELAALAERRPAELSGGEAQRVALARALALRPRALLLDEPLSSLDAESRPKVRALLREILLEFRGPRLIITHDPLDALLLADQLVVLEAGRVVQAGPVEEVRRRPRTRFIATLTGVNLLNGALERAAGSLCLRAGALRLPLPTSGLSEGTEVRATVHPSAVAISFDPPQSPSTAWETRIAAVELAGEHVHLRLEEPEGFSAELASEAVDLRRLTSGARVWASVPATEIHIFPR